MSPNLERAPAFAILPDEDGAYADLQPAYRASLVAPQDDMWAAFADAACPYALILEDRIVGFCSVNDRREILSFFVEAAVEDRAEAAFEAVVEALEPIAAYPSTVDPGFLSLSLAAGREAETRALLFRHVLEPEGRALGGLRLASMADLAATIAFAEAAAGAPKSFLEPYLAERIERGELLLLEEEGKIAATGECRRDQRSPGHAQLGMVVGRNRQGVGLGSGILHALVLESRRRGLEPLCSTEPGNRAARRAIHRAGFRSRHRVFRVPLAPRPSPPS